MYITFGKLPEVSRGFVAYESIMNNQPVLVLHRIYWTWT